MHSLNLESSSALLDHAPGRQALENKLANAATSISACEVMPLLQFGAVTVLSKCFKNRSLHRSE